MNKRYLLSTNPASGVDAAVFATGAESPIESLCELEEELAINKVVGTVLFDVLLSQGSRANRYFIGEFDGQHFNMSKLRPATRAYDSYALLSASFLKEHYSEIDPCLLTGAMRFALRKGVPF